MNCTGWNDGFYSFHLALWNVFFLENMVANFVQLEHGMYSSFVRIVALNFQANYNTNLNSMPWRYGAVEMEGHIQRASAAKDIPDNQ